MPFFTLFNTYIFFLLIFFFFICQKISFLLPQISFSLLLLMWLFCVSLSTLRAYFSLFTVFATWRNAIEKLKVDCMGISYFSFTARSPFLFPPISVKYTILRCFRPPLPNHFTPLSLLLCPSTMSSPSLTAAWYLTSHVVDKYSNPSQLYWQTWTFWLRLHWLFLPFFSIARLVTVPTLAAVTVTATL